MRIALPLAVVAAFPLIAVAGDANAQSPPTFQQYPLRDRLLGSGGAVFPDYVFPGNDDITFFTGVGARGGKASRGAIFAAGTADFLCQQTEMPTIRMLDVPPGGRVTVTPGTFIITGRDGGAMNPCLGRPLRGMVVRFKGRAAPGATVRLRVIYPPLGVWYDHVVPVTAR